MGAPIMSTLPDDFVQGGLINDVDVEVMASKVVVWDYRGQADPVCALCWSLRPLDSQETADHYFSCGPESDFVPSADGKYICAVVKEEGQRTSLAKNSNYHRLITSLHKYGGATLAKWVTENGHDQNKWAGLQFHLMRTKRDSIAGSEEKKDEKKRRGFEETAVIASKIIRWPWEPRKATAVVGKTPGAAVAAAVASKAAPSAPVAVGADGRDEQARLLLDKLVTEDGGASTWGPDKQVLAQWKLRVFRGAPEDKETRNALTAMLTDLDWLKQQDGFVVDESTILKA